MTAIGVIVLIFMIINWQTIPILQKVIGFYLMALACHEWEELKFPGGFVELVMDMTGLEIGNLGIAKFGLFIFTVYATLIPLFLYWYIWPCIAPILVGYVESIAHLAAARIHKGKFYSPGMITALCLQLPVSLYGTWYMFGHGLMKGIYWLWAVLYLLIPLLIVQGSIVKSNGMAYREFMKNAKDSLMKKKIK